MKAFFTEGGILKLSEICMWHVTASHVATFGVWSCGEKYRSFFKDISVHNRSSFIAFEVCRLPFQSAVLWHDYSQSQSFLYNSCKPNIFLLYLHSFQSPHNTVHWWGSLDHAWLLVRMQQNVRVSLPCGKSVPHYSRLSLTFNICDQRETLAIDLFAVHRQECSAVLAKQTLTLYNLQLNSVSNHLCHEQFTIVYTY